MGQNDRKRTRSFSALVNEMQADIIHVGFEVSESVEGNFVLPPIVGVMPVANEVPEIVDIGAEGPICALRMRKPGVFEPPAKVA